MKKRKDIHKEVRGGRKLRSVDTPDGITVRARYVRRRLRLEVAPLTKEQFQAVQAHRNAMAASVAAVTFEDGSREMIEDG